MPLNAHADVATATPERYAKQLASHLGRKAEIREEDAGVRIVLTVGDCLLTSTDGVLHLTATAEDDAGLDVVTDVVGRHLERFGQRNELVVTWSR
ncbi:DUF2218 domain-containing protein [Nocardioides fonticola]|uniref:DUF2218 domain-containing protein n=1 Tax=Nocardioides fonticola TaxID=450363 RepID=A0ABP7XNZ5_9ACTN